MSDSGDDAGAKVEEIEGGSQKWHGYSDYQNVAVDLREETNKAIEAYSHINSCSSQGIGITPQTAVNAKSAILRITKRLSYEIKKNAQVDEFTEMHERWAGVVIEEAEDGDGLVVMDDPDNEGFVSMLEDADFRTGEPPWLRQLMDDVITAGWELGYIRAGVEKAADPDRDEEQVKDMFE